MTKKWQWLLQQLTRRLWFRAGLLSLLAIATALVAALVAPYIPSDLPGKIGADAVNDILNILASSLLAVAIFSLSTAVSAYANATRSVTPRATQLLIEDVTTQNVLATFVGSFIFSLVGIIALSAGVYGSQGRVVLFIVTILVIALIVVTLLGWIDHLSRLGTVSETTTRVERATAEALKARVNKPFLGCNPLRDPAKDIPPDAQPIYSSTIGYVRHLDVAALSECADTCGGELFVTTLPGTFVEPSRPLAWSIDIAPAHTDDVRKAFTIGNERSFDQDPRFGLTVLAEIASRALSPAINDPGTAIDIIGRTVRVLSIWVNGEREQKNEVSFRRIHVPEVSIGDLFDDLFNPIARDGAAFVEVQIRLQKALRALATMDPRYAKHAARHAQMALERAEAALLLGSEKMRLRELASSVDKLTQ